MIYVVATPIGNLSDISQRALDVLNDVDFIVAEDTRVTAHLLNTYNIRTSVVSCHQYSTQEVVGRIISRVNTGESMALVCDAGTPVISDPGYSIVAMAQEHNIKVYPVPGASALTAAISVSGLPCEKFIFEGFLPAKSQARCKRLDMLKQESRSMVFYEAPHRIVACLEDMKETFGSDRMVSVSREMTKKFETYNTLCLSDMVEFVISDPMQTKGENVIIVEGYKLQTVKFLDEKMISLAKMLKDDLPLKKIAKVISRITAINQRSVYAELVVIFENNT
jgi:16S rRNA (cytidine1402-2'-O)-methyltransferase